jgi:hypothetical protein
MKPQFMAHRSDRQWQQHDRSAALKASAVHHVPACTEKMCHKSFMGMAIPPSHFIFLHKMFGSPSIWVQVGFASSTSEQDMKGRTQE